MKSAKFGMMLLLFWVSFIMWLGFANGVWNGLHPMRGATSNFDFMDIIYSTLFYFLPHLLITLGLLLKYRNDIIEINSENEKGT